MAPGYHRIRFAYFLEIECRLMGQRMLEDLPQQTPVDRNPELVWGFYSIRQPDSGKSTDPIPGHIALAEIEQSVPKFTLYYAALWMGCTCVPGARIISRTAWQYYTGSMH